MADIDIEKKRKPFWPWLLAILLIVAGVWVAIEVIDIDQEPGVAERTETTGEGIGDENRMQGVENEQEEAVPQEVADYGSFVDDTANMGLPHDYTSSGLIRLASALEAVVNKYDLDQQVNIDEATRSIRSKAQFIQDNPESRQHADSIKAAFVAAENVLNELSEHYPDLENQINQVSDQSGQLDKGSMTLEQESAVKNFFRQTQDVLEEMAENKPVNI